MPPTGSPEAVARPQFPVGLDRGADRASNDADASSIPPIIPYGGFSPVRLGGWRFGRRLPNASLSSSLLPAYADHVLVCFRPSCIPSYPRMSRSVSGRLRADAPPWRVGNPPPQGVLARVRVVLSRSVIT